jgi:hypothetical protein
MDSEPADNEANPKVSPTQTAATETERSVKANPDAKDLSSSRTVWQDEKATANAKHDRPEHQSRNEPLGDALSIGAGQVSSPYLTQTQANAIARQANRKDGK